MKILFTIITITSLMLLASITFARGGGGSHSGGHSGGHVSSEHVSTGTRAGGTKVSAPKAPKTINSTKTTTPKIQTPKTRAPVNVHTYVKPKTGTVVQSHVRTAPNKTQRDNWSSKPNVNPNTGKKGTITPKK